METNIQTTCPHCNNPILPIDIFCPACGKKLKRSDLSTGIQKQIGVYLLSFFLPPFGLFPAIKYLRQADSKSKKIGVIALVLTVISILITISLTSFCVILQTENLRLSVGSGTSR